MSGNDDANKAIPTFWASFDWNTEDSILSNFDELINVIMNKQNKPIPQTIRFQ